jgi:hypothetical protein
MWLMRLPLLLVLLLFFQKIDQPPPPLPPIKEPVVVGTGPLSLGEPREVDFKYGKLITIDADGVDEVTWLIECQGGTDTKDLENIRYPKSIKFPIPEPGTVVMITAAAVQNGKAVLAKTTVTVRGASSTKGPAILYKDSETKEPEKNLPGIRVASIAIVFKNGDAAANTPLGRLLAMPTLQAALAAKGVQLRKPVDVADPDPLVRRLNFGDTYNNQVGGPFVKAYGANEVPIPGAIWKLDSTNLTGDPAGDLHNLLGWINRLNGVR